MGEVHFKQINKVTGPEKWSLRARISGYGGQVRGNGGNVAKILDM